jgi:RNA polymerase sigma-70 factor (ECF subfamily)
MTINYSDEQLCKMVKNPKEKEWAFKMILKIYQERLYVLIRRMVNSHEDTDDILQNTFLKVYKYIHTFENKSSLYTWMYKIALNETLRFLEHQKMQKKIQEAAVQYANESNAHDIQSFEEEKIWTLLNQGIAMLPPRQRMVFSLRYFEQMPYTEMAILLKVSEGSLKASFHHALQKLSSIIKEKAQ